MHRSPALKATSVLFAIAALTLVSCAKPRTASKVLVDVAVSPEIVSLEIGATAQLKLTGTYSDGHTADLTEFAQWTVDYASIGSLSTMPGLVTGVAAGECTVTGSMDSFSATVAVSVTDPNAALSAGLASISVSNPGGVLIVGQWIALQATGLYSNGTTGVITSLAQWTSSNPDVARVDATGTVTAIGPGAVRIVAAMGTIAGSTNFTIMADMHTLSNVSIVARPSNLMVGSTFQLGAEGTFSDGTSADITSQVTWASSYASVASVSASGLLTVLAGGTTTISATLEGLADEFPLNIPIIVPTLVSIAVTPANPIVAAGATDKLTATGTYSDGSTAILTSNVFWASSNTLVATVNGQGIVTGVATGSVTITAAVGAVTSAPLSITVPAAMMGTESSCHPVINEVQPGVAGNSTDEFIELYNACNASVDVTGWTVSYRATGSTTSHLLVTLNKPMGAHEFLVLGYMSSTGVGYPKTMDYTYSSTSLASTSGGIEMAWAATGIATGVMVDSMSYGTQVAPYNTYTQGAPAAYAGDTNPAHSIARSMDGVSTGNNSKDFAKTTTPTPGEPNVVTK